MADKTKPEDRQEYIKAKIRKYGKNWKEHITSGVLKNKPTLIKRERAQKGLGAALRGGGRAFLKGGKV